MKEIKGEIHFFQCLGYIAMGPFFVAWCGDMVVLAVVHNTIITGPKRWLHHRLGTFENL